MPMNDPLKDELLASDPAFRILWDEHQDCERRLNEILHRSMPVSYTHLTLPTICSV